MKKKNVNKLVLSDINIDLYPSIQETNEFNKLQNVEFILSDCFDTIGEENQFDVIVSNPPHFKTIRPDGYRSREEKLISLDFDMEFHKKLFDSAHKFLKPNGKIILIENCDGVTEADIRMLSDEYFTVETVDYDSYGWQGKSTFYTIVLTIK